MKKLMDKEIAKMYKARETGKKNFTGFCTAMVVQDAIHTCLKEESVKADESLNDLLKSI